MKAVIRSRYGFPDALQFTEIEKPTPTAGQVLVRVQAASLNKSDWYLLRGRPLLARMIDGGLLGPKRKILGSDLAGSVEAVGEGVTRFRVGDDVFGFARGTLAEYVCAFENRLALKPADLSYQEAAAAPIAGSTAMQAMRAGRPKAGRKVLIDGGSGGVGTFAVIIAKSLGAEVTAVCSTGKREHALSIGADFVIDYSKVDFAKTGQKWDLVIVINGYHSILGYLRALNPNGICVVVGSSKRGALLQAVLMGRFVSKLGSKKVMLAGPRLNSDDLTDLSGFLSRSGSVSQAIDRRYTLAEAATAFQYLGEGHARGKVILTMPPLNATPPEARGIS